MKQPPTVRIGHGFDLHRLEPGLELIVGGVHFDHNRGCAAHSDGDVVYHAVTDALLGALGCQDLGTMFPDDDPRWRGTDSGLFVSAAVGQVRQAGLGIQNLDVTVILQAPKLTRARNQMRGNLARLLGCDQGQVNIKGKTHEKVDALGQGRAIACHAVLILARW